MKNKIASELKLFKEWVKADMELTKALHDELKQDGRLEELITDIHKLLRFLKKLKGHDKKGILVSFSVPFGVLRVHKHKAKNARADVHKFKIMLDRLIDYLEHGVGKHFVLEHESVNLELEYYQLILARIRKWEDDLQKGDKKVQKEIRQECRGQQEDYLHMQYLHKNEIGYINKIIRLLKQYEKDLKKVDISEHYKKYIDEIYDDLAEIEKILKNIEKDEAYEKMLYSRVIKIDSKIEDIAKAAIRRAIKQKI